MSAQTRAVIYARVSSSKQRDKHTIASQLRVLPDFVASQGWTLVRPARHYVDDGKSAKAGHLEKREAFRRLLEDAEVGQFDVVVVVEDDRITRSDDLLERLEIFGRFKRAGVKLAFEATRTVIDPNSSTDELLAIIKGWVSADDNRKRIKRITEAKLTAISKGKKPSGPTPYGYSYDRETGLWAPHTTTSAIVVEVFERIAGGESCETIAVEFNRRRLSPPSQNWNRQAESWEAAKAVWHRERVWAIVRRETYRTGIWVPDKARGLTISVPKLVDDGLWHRAQEVLLRYKRRGLRKTKHTYLCEEIAICGLCGAWIGVSSAWGRRPAYYVCSHRRRPLLGTQPCTLPMQRTSDIDARVWNAVAELLARPDVVGYALSQREAEARGTAQDWEQDLISFERKLKQIEEADARILERFRRGKIGEGTMDMHLEASVRDREMLKRQIEIAHGQSRVGRASEHALSEVRVMIRTLQVRTAKASPEVRRDLVRALVPGRHSGRSGAKGLPPNQNHVIVLGPADLSIGVILSASSVVPALAVG